MNTSTKEIGQPEQVTNNEQNADNQQVSPSDANAMLAASSGDLRKFVWVGLNKHFNEIQVSQPLTTEDLLEGNYPSFFSMRNRMEEGNCKFLMEIFEGDNLIYYSKNSMSGMTVKNENGVFIGQGPFNDHPLETYFNATDFINMEIDSRSCC